MPEHSIYLGNNIFGQIISQGLVQHMKVYYIEQYVVFRHIFFPSLVRYSDENMWKTLQPFSKPKSLGFDFNLHNTTLINEINDRVISLYKFNIALKLCAHANCVDNSRRYAELWDTFHSKLWKEYNSSFISSIVSFIFILIMHNHHSTLLYTDSICVIVIVTSILLVTILSNTTLC